MHPIQFELTPASEFSPTWPANNTMPAAALARLLTGERLTQPTFGTNRWRLAAYIKELKYLGWPVEATRVHHPGRGHPIAQYWLNDDIIMKVRALRSAA